MTLSGVGDRQSHDELIRVHEQCGELVLLDASNGDHARVKLCELE